MQVKHVAQSRDNNTPLGGRLGSHYFVPGTHHFMHVPCVNSFNPCFPDKNLRATRDSHALPNQGAPIT